MKQLTFGRILIIIALGLLGWALCGAIMFLLIVILMDFFLVALVINKSMEMFQSPLGTWIPFGLIFLSIPIRIPTDI